MGAPKVITRLVTIPSGGALSGEVELNGALVVGIQMPAAWTAANLTFQEGPAAGAFQNLYDKDGVEYQVVTAADRRHTISPADIAGARSIKVRSGTSATPVNQGADRIVTLILRSE